MDKRDIYIMQKIYAYKVIAALQAILELSDLVFDEHEALEGRITEFQEWLLNESPIA